MLEVSRLRSFSAVVFDLDGTLLVLGVDWTATEREMIRVAKDRFSVDLSNLTVWQMLRSSENRQREALESVLSRREMAGARKAERLPLAEVLPSLQDRGVGVVSLNSRASCMAALERTQLSEYVDVLVAREDSERMKPDPEPLLKCIALLEVEASEAVFVGDRERDRTTAREAGVKFIHAREIRI